MLFQCTSWVDVWDILPGISRVDYALRNKPLTIRCFCQVYREVRALEEKQGQGAAGAPAAGAMADGGGEQPPPADALGGGGTAARAGGLALGTVSRILTIFRLMYEVH